MLGCSDLALIVPFLASTPLDAASRPFAAVAAAVVGSQAVWNADVVAVGALCVACLAACPQCVPAVADGTAAAPAYASAAAYDAADAVARVKTPESRVFVALPLLMLSQCLALLQDTVHCDT